jgi:tripartite-type tricarboxylate transporter receptor subunit TctC
MGGLAAKAADVDFSGKTIEFWVPYKEGGGSDVWARSVAPLLSKHLPGNPDVVVVNNHQGGGIGGTNEFHRRMEPTGEMIFNASGSNLIAYLLKDSRVQYEYLDFIPFLASPTGAIIYLVRPEKTSNILNRRDSLAASLMR